jgi:2-aminoethylphosphonate-pyruvate transaminase
MSRCNDAVILAAGLGSRLGSAHAERPKGFISIGGESLIRRSVRLLLGEGIERITIVSGHLAEYYDELKNDYPEIRTVRNERYADSGSMYSLWCARDLPAVPFLLLESDLIYERRALTSLQRVDLDNAILLSGKTDSGDEVYVETQGELVRRMSKKTAELQSIAGELTGISKISGELFQGMQGYAEKWFQAKDLKLEYENCINGAIENGVRVWQHKIDDLIWCEIDNAEHWTRARTLIFPAIQRRECAGWPSVKRNVLLNPGPATTTDTVKGALVVPDICHREKEFVAITNQVHRELVQVVGGGDDYAAVTFAGSGTAAVEAVMGSVVPRDRKILIVDNGAYGARMRQIAGTLGIEVVVEQCSVEQAPSLSRIEAAFEKEQGAISHLAIVHHETTTGLLNPVRECAAIAKRFGAEIIVDAMSSYAGIPIDIAAWDIDYLTSSANKCLQGMAGISFVICRRRALAEAAKIAPRSLYLSLVDQYQACMGGGEARFTPPVQLFYALRQALREYFAEGGAERHARYAGCYEELMPGMKHLGFEPLLPVNLHSKLLTSFVEPENPRYSFDAMHDDLYGQGFTIYPGKVASKNTFRIANIGAIERSDIRNFLTALEAHLKRNNV